MIKILHFEDGKRSISIFNDSDSNELESNSESEDYNYNPNEIAKDIYNNDNITDNNYSSNN
ncbi:hypothetical protein RhiirA4_466692 [Rhizophagus irregularis]|uniref:Uncharacterized protein n=1 Tax=Rhizophagus irregularis TaxID=588596 RepID=A0A2I1GUF9_9GLOM|nr:hypothetical protein RhiirA4_466692 [Rhizophagus irregularis]